MSYPSTAVLQVDGKAVNPEAQWWRQHVKGTFNSNAVLALLLNDHVASVTVKDQTLTVTTKPHMTLDTLAGVMTAVCGACVALDTAQVTHQVATSASVVLVVTINDAPREAV